jgi:hypothetical protein
MNNENEPQKGDLVGLQRSSRWGTRIRVVLDVENGKARLADRNGTYEAPITSLNRTFPGFVDSPLSPAMEREFGLKS